MSETKATKQEPQAKPLGPSKREKIITGVVAVVFIIVVVTIALVQKFNGQ